MKGSEQDAGEESAPKKSAWDGYRRYHVVARIVFPILFGTIVFAEFAPHWIEKIMPVFFPVFMLFGLASLPFQYFRCPKCDELFFYPTGFFSLYRPWARKCPHCGLPKWEDPPPKPPKVDSYPSPRFDGSRPDPAIAERLRLAKFLTLVLCDDPKAIGLSLDANGWANVGDLLKRANRNGIKLTRENLGDVLTVSENHRFERDQPGDRIRWVKG